MRAPDRWDWLDLQATPGYVAPGRTRVLAAVVAIHARAGRVTMNDLVAELGNSRSTIHQHLVLLRRDGLVGWTTGRAGTMHPLVRLAPVT